MMLLDPRLKDTLPPVICKRLDQNFRKKGPKKESIVAKSSKQFAYRRFVNRIPDWDLFCLCIITYAKGNNFNPVQLKNAEIPVNEVAKKEQEKRKRVFSGEYKITNRYLAEEIGMMANNSNSDINRINGFGFDIVSDILETAFILSALGIETPFEIIYRRNSYAAIDFYENAKLIYENIDSVERKKLGGILLLDHGLVQYMDGFLPFKSFFDFGFIRGYGSINRTNFNKMHNANGICMGSDFLASESATATTAPHELMHVFDNIIGLKYTDITAADSEFRAILAGTNGLDSEGKKYAMNNNLINMKTHPHHYEAGERIKKMFSKIPKNEIESDVLRILNREYKRLTSVYETSLFGLTYDDILEPWRK